MGMKATAAVLRMTAVVVCAAGTCLSDTGVCSGPGGPDCCSTMPGDVDGTPPVNLRDFARLAGNWKTDIAPAEGSSQSDPDFYPDLLKKVVVEAPILAAGDVSFVRRPVEDPLGSYALVDRRLAEPEGVPYLIHVLRNGPGWSDVDVWPRYGDQCRYLARCYAALCLGVSKDSRALGPLLEILQDTTVLPLEGTPSHQDDWHDLREYAAIALGDLADCRAIGPLAISLQNDRYSECIFSLLKLNAFSSVPTIINVMREHDLFNFSSTSRALECALRIEFAVAYSQEDHTWKVAQFPELVGHDLDDIYEKTWVHWLAAGDQYAREGFDAYYPQWDAAIREQPGNTSHQRVLLGKMLRGGVAVMPYVIDKMKQGDHRLVKALRNLTFDWRVENCTADQWLQWWRTRRQQWQVFDTTSVTRILRVPEKYPTIQAAIDDAKEGDLVLVGPGTYGEAVKMRDGVDLAGSGAAETILSAERTHAVVNGASHCRLDGFTITGYAHEDIDGVYCEDVNDFAVLNCVIKDSTWSGVNAVRSSVVIRNNVICGNRCAGVFLSYPAAEPTVIINNTIWNNANEADINIWHGAQAFVQNNILQDIDRDEASLVELHFNDIVNQPAEGDNIQVDPLFADPNAGDFHLLSQAGRCDPSRGDWVLDEVTSPCIDAGDPNNPLGGEPEPNGGRINLGAYGGTAEASKSNVGDDMR